MNSLFSKEATIWLRSVQGEKSNGYLGSIEQTRTKYSCPGPNGRSVSPKACGVDNSRQAHGDASLEVLVELLIDFQVGLVASVAVEGPWCSVNAMSSYTGSKHSAGRKHARKKINLPWVAVSHVRAFQLMCVQKYLLLLTLS